MITFFCNSQFTAEWEPLFMELFALWLFLWYETEILLLPWLPHTLASPGSPQAWHLPSALRFWVRALGLVASDAGRPWSLLIKMHHPHNTVMELEGGSSLRRAAVKAAQTTCVFFHCDSA